LSTYGGFVDVVDVDDGGTDPVVDVGGALVFVAGGGSLGLRAGSRVSVDGGGAAAGGGAARGGAALVIGATGAVSVAAVPVVSRAIGVPN
jgi:hypothetical protein